MGKKEENFGLVNKILSGCFVVGCGLMLVGLNVELFNWCSYSFFPFLLKLSFLGGLLAIDSIVLVRAKEEWKNRRGDFNG